MQTWPLFFFFLYVYRSAMSLVAQIYVFNLTKLGDSGQYQNATFDDGSCGLPAVSSTCVTEYIAILFHSVGLGDKILINMAFQTIAFAGLYILMMSLDSHHRKIVAPLLFLPTFTIWSSIAGKEAIVVFALCILLTRAVKFSRGNRKASLLDLFAGALLLLFKPHYFAALVFLGSGLVALTQVRQKAFLVLLGSLGSFGLLYIFRQAIGDEAIALQAHFPASIGLSTRSGEWTESYDVFRTMFGGMWLAFVGPTLREALANPLQLVALVESLLMVFFLGFLFVRRLPTLPIFSAVLVVTTIFWILFANYPFGFFNPGSAIRYRTGYLPLVLIVVVVFLSRDLVILWSQKHLPKETKPTPKVRDLTTP
jgi:hypothetical protein